MAFGKQVINERLSPHTADKHGKKFIGNTTIIFHGGSSISESSITAPFIYRKENQSNILRSN